MILYEILITSTVLICGIFCLRKLSKGKISMRLRYALWLLVAVRLLVPASVGTSALSVMNLVPVVMRERAQTFFSEERNSWRMPADGGRDVASDGGTDGVFADGRHMGTELTDGQSGAENGVVMTAGNTASGENMPETAEGVGTDTARGNDSFAAAENSGLSLNGVLGMLWLLGFLAVGGYMVVSEYRFIRYLHKNRKAFPAEEIPAEFAGRFSRREMKVYRVKGLPGPCLAGRHIYIGEGVAVQQNLSHILAHEYCHALHGDGLWAFLRCALAAVYWFDPLVWAAAYAARQDSELACDEAAVKLLGESSRFDYGRTLLALLESAECRGKCPGMTFMTEGGERGVRERITALTEKKRTRGAVLAAVLLAVLSIPESVAGRVSIPISIGVGLFFIFIPLVSRKRAMSYKIDCFRETIINILGTGLMKRSVLTTDAVIRELDRHEPEKTLKKVIEKFLAAEGRRYPKYEEKCLMEQLLDGYRLKLSDLSLLQAVGNSEQP